MSKVDSIIICHSPKGYIASLRFQDSKEDRELSATSHWMIYEQIERMFDEDGQLLDGASTHRQAGAHLRHQRHPRFG